MAGIHGGVQAKIRELNPKAIFVPCANHSLNLCGVHALSNGPQCVTFFGTLEKIYSIFVVSTHRWEVLKGFGCKVKRLSNTRWSVSYEAVKAVASNFSKLVDALESLGDPKENADTMGAVQLLLPAVCKFSFIAYLDMWNNVLREVDDAQNYLQKSGLSLEQCAVKLRSLKLFLETNRDQLGEDSIAHATLICGEMEISMEKRTRYRKRQFGEEPGQTGISLVDETKLGMLACLDRFLIELSKRSEAYDRILDIFAIIQPASLLFENKEYLEQHKTNLLQVYDETCGDSIVPEILRLRRHLHAAGIKTTISKTWNALQFLEFIYKWDFAESLPNLALCFRLVLTVSVSVASCERSFSKLKLIKTFLRSTMGEDRLTNLAILSIENTYTNKIDFEGVIDAFAEVKSRRGNFKSKN